MTYFFIIYIIASKIGITCIQEGTIPYYFIHSTLRKIKDTSNPRVSSNTSYYLALFLLPRERRGNMKKFVESLIFNAVGTILLLSLTIGFCSLIGIVGTILGIY